MNLTKHEHACLVLEKGGETVVIDPGSFTMPLSDLSGVVAVVITHQHADHWTPAQLDRIIERNPSVLLFGPAGVAAAAEGYPVTVVADGDTHEVGAFTLAFYGEKHAVIHSSIPVIDNVGVLVDNDLFYPGDSFTIPPVPVDTLAVPAGAPWLKISEAMDYLEAVTPHRAFPTHEMVLSVIGQDLSNARLGESAARAGAEYVVLAPGESLAL